MVEEEQKRGDTMIPAGVVAGPAVAPFAVAVVTLAGDVVVAPVPLGISFSEKNPSFKISSWQFTLARKAALSIFLFLALSSSGSSGWAFLMFSSSFFFF